MPKLLHVGCGPKRKAQTTPGFNTPDWEEVRLDIDPSVAPDVIGTMTDMGAVASGSMDAVFSSHSLEHLFPHEAPLALAEFRRVLAPDGFAIITCPDLQSVAALVAQDKLTDPAYQSGMGPIAPIDIIYGLRGAIARGNHYMAHKSGYTRKVLIGTLRQAGFPKVAAMQRPFAFDLWAVACMADVDDLALRALASAHFPTETPY
jgi:hypothetical protein